MKKGTQRWVTVLLSLSLALVICAAPLTAAYADDDPMNYKGKVRVGAQTVNEAIVLAWIAGLLIEDHTGLKPEMITEFAASSVVHQAMVAGELDVYVSWTGTQLTGILRYDGPNLSGEETFRRVKEGFEKELGFTWAKPLGFNNTYVMTVRRETAEKYNLKKASDLAPYAEDWLLGCDENFDTRPDAYPGWSEAYGIKFKDVLPMQYSIMYRAIDNEEVDVIPAYSTDSRIPKMDLVMLEDDKEFFPDYSAGYVIDMKYLKKYPKVLEILEKLSGTIDEETMAKMNSRFDDGEEAEDIARDYLVSVGLIGK
ncbi:MAG: glycine betaine ABC transporter substrate-binding protein [Synergistales bacterium]|jgi:osmoprotectant transport system substrate-binding protein|nr:glycine betaine ABC transporter substrate-binding protein [Synergistales bacterium]